MNRRELAAAIFFTIAPAKLSGSKAQDTGGHGGETGTARRMRAACAEFLTSLDDAARAAVSYPLDSQKRAAWSNIPISMVPRPGVSIASLGNESRRAHDPELRIYGRSLGGAVGGLRHECS